MKRFAILALAAVVSVGAVGCCSSPLQKKAVENLEDTHNLIFPEYVRLVEKEYPVNTGDYDLDKKNKEKVENRKGLVKSARDLTEAMKKDLED